MSSQNPTDGNLIDKPTDEIETAEKKTEKVEKSKTVKIDNKVRWIIFFFIAVLSTLSTIDGGIIPAATDQMMAPEALNATETQMGWLGSMDYLGRIEGSLVFVAIINTTDRKLILVGTLFIKGVAMMLPFFFRTQFIFNLLLRAAAGFSQVYYTIYFPVWCDQYGTKAFNTMMITLVQLGTPLGIVLGFALCTFVGKQLWYTCFFIQSIILFALGVALLFFPQLYFSNKLMMVEGSDVEMKELEENSEEKEARDIELQLKDGSSDNAQPQPQLTPPLKKKKTIISNIIEIVSEKVFLFSGLANSVIFFGMAVVQFWGASYMKNVLQEDNDFVLLYVFSAICITGPPAGVILGGLVGNKIGGYTVKPAIVYCTIFCGVSCIFAVIVTFFKSVAFFGVTVWLYFLFSGAMIPLITGIILSSLPARLRGDGFSVMNFLLNLTGNLPAASAYGAIYEATKYTHDTWAMMFTMDYNCIGFVFVVIAMIFRLRKKDEEGPKQLHEQEQPAA